MPQVYGSIHNRMMENVKSPVPIVGMGVTILMYSDRHAATIVEICSPSTIIVQRDIATRIDKNGMSENQEYNYTPDTNAPKEVVTLRKDGRWKLTKEKTVVRLGERDAYYDFSF